MNQMAVCGLCGKVVNSLKTNSHILPRWVNVLIKDKGKAVKISEEEVHLGHQTDPVADIVCDECEDRFTENDTWAAEFFRDKKYFLRNQKFGPIIAEIQSASAKEPLLRFLVSQILREDLRLKQNGKNGLLGIHFDEVAKLYLARTNLVGIYPLVVTKYEALEKAATPPYTHDYEGIQAIQDLILGYRFFIFITKEKPDNFLADYFAGPDELTIPIESGTNNKLVKDLFEMADSAPKRGGRREKK